MQRFLLLLLLCVPSFIWGQEADTLRLPDFRGIRMYKSLNGALQQPDSVIRLDLSKQKLKEVPEEIRKFPNLKELNLSKNNIRELPEWIAEFKHLEILDLSNNKLEALPASIGQLSKLGILRLNRNVIETLPAEMGLLVNLQVLEMWDNELVAVPEEMKKLRNLKVFELRGILFTHEEQLQIQDLLPDTRIYFSPHCNCTH